MTMKINEREQNNKSTKKAELQQKRTSDKAVDLLTMFRNCSFTCPNPVFITASLSNRKTRDESPRTILSQGRETVFHINREYLKWQLSMHTVGIGVCTSRRLIFQRKKRTNIYSYQDVHLFTNNRTVRGKMLQKSCLR